MRPSSGPGWRVVIDVLARPAWFGHVFGSIYDEDEVVRMPAADVVGKVTVHAPEMLRPFEAEFLARLPGTRQPEARGHEALLLPRFELTRDERDTLALSILGVYLRDKSRLVLTFALQAPADFARDDEALQPEVVGLIETAMRTGSAAVRRRARRLLPKLERIKPPVGGGVRAGPHHRP